MRMWILQRDLCATSAYWYLQVQLDTVLQSENEATQQMSTLRAELEDSRRTATSHAMSAAKKLADSQVRLSRFP